MRIVHHTNPSTQLHQNVVNLVNVEGKVSGDAKDEWVGDLNASLCMI